MHWTCRRRVRFAHAQTLAYICKLVAGTFSRQVPRFTRSWQLENEVRCLSGLHGQGKMESDLLDQAHLGDCLDSDDDE